MNRESFAAMMGLALGIAIGAMSVAAIVPRKIQYRAHKDGDKITIVSTYGRKYPAIFKDGLYWEVGKLGY